MSAAQRIRFGLFELDTQARKLYKQGRVVRVQDQPLLVLELLLEKPGQVVTREELRRRLWPGNVYVDFELGLTGAMKRLRQALDDSASNPRFVATAPKSGYRFIAGVEFIAPVEVSAPAELGEPRELATRTAPALPPLLTRVWPLLTSTALILAFLGWKYARNNHTVVAAPPKSIAVLPFSNEGAGPAFDYLRYAIANDLVTDLMHAHSVSVRPFSSTRSFASQSADPVAIAEQLRVSHVVAGGFLLDQNTLHVNIELVDVAQNRPVWRDELTVSPPELVSLHDRLAASAAQGLLPSINLGVSPETIPAPKNEQAFQLFQHSLTIPLDPEPNLIAIKKLEESVSLDAGYAPAWEELGWRYYIDYHYGHGGAKAADKALQAYKRQSELDPSMPVVSTTIRVEQGDLNGAYDQAVDLLRRRPDMSIAHYGMSYVLRYAGLLDEAGKQCDAALAIDPGFNVFRSCAKPFLLKGDYERAQSYIHLDDNSGFAAFHRMLIALRTKNTDVALVESSAVSRAYPAFADMAHLYLTRASPAELSKAAAALEESAKSGQDPEELFHNAEILSLAGQPAAALRQLRNAISGNYCSYPAMDQDPLFDPVRRQVEFAQLRQVGIQCQQNFLKHREQVSGLFGASH